MNQHTVKILAVDDTPANLEVLTECLTRIGYDIAVAINGERALNRLQTYQPHLILLDVQMPGIDGFETCRQIKANPQWESIPIIFITALNDGSSIAKGFSLGAVDYISKPFQESELLARVKTHLQLQQMNQQLERLVEDRTQALEAAMDQLKASQLQTVQIEKMATLGNLVAGVAHEVNNPIGFLHGSISNAKDYLKELFEYLETYRAQQPHNEVVQERAEEIDLDFVLEDLPKLLVSMQSATDRIRNISNSLRTFSRADTAQKVSGNLHEGLDSTLLILKYRLKASENRPAIEVVKHYGDVPKINCFPGQLNQVFMNILANAIDALDDVSQNRSLADTSSNPHRITIRTSMENDQVKITIADNGPGIPEEIKAKIFDHLFTTKEVGKGTGLGLAIAHQIVVDTHGGELNMQSDVGQGTEFCICLPI